MSVAHVYVLHCCHKAMRLWWRVVRCGCSVPCQIKRKIGLVRKQTARDVLVPNFAIVVLKGFCNDAQPAARSRCYSLRGRRNSHEGRNRI